MNVKKYDVIIIGAGLGGLISGAKLVQAGKKVCLLEQHTIPGGCATTFRRKGFNIEVGLHEMDGLYEGEYKYEIFQSLGIFDHLTFLRVPEFYRVISDRFDFVMKDNAVEAQNDLIQLYLHEKKGIKKYFKTVLKIRANIQRLPKTKLPKLLFKLLFPFLFPYLVSNQKQTLSGFLNSCIQDEDLKLILSANMAYYHDDPRTLAMIWYGAAQASYFIGGGHFVKGGSQNLSDYLASRITKNGSVILFSTQARKIEVQDGTVSGVHYVSLRNGQEEYIEAEHVIANAALPLIPAMLSEPYRSTFSAPIKNLMPACSLLSVYIGFNKPMSALGNKAYSTIVMDKSLTNLDDIQSNAKSGYDTCSFIFVDYSMIDADLAPEGKNCGAICVIDYLENWDSLSEERYKAKKQHAAQCLIARLDKLIPGAADCIEYFDVGTARTIKRYTNNPEGSAYGYAQTTSQGNRNRPGPTTPIPGLYIASAWGNPGGGFTGAIVGGAICAKTILSQESHKTS